MKVDDRLFKAPKWPNSILKPFPDFRLMPLVNFVFHKRPQKTRTLVRQNKNVFHFPDRWTPTRSINVNIQLCSSCSASLVDLKIDSSLCHNGTCFDRYATLVAPETESTSCRAQGQHRTNILILMPNSPACLVSQVRSFDLSLSHYCKIRFAISQGHLSLFRLGVAPAPALSFPFVTDTKNKDSGGLL